MNETNREVRQSAIVMDAFRGLVVEPVWSSRAVEETGRRDERGMESAAEPVFQRIKGTRCP